MKTKVEEVTELLRSMTKEEREEVKKNFCRTCWAPIDKPDWSGRNFCIYCSPDPEE